MRGQGKKKEENTTCRLILWSQVTCLRMLNVFPMPCGLNFLRFHEHIAFHKAFHKHKNDISIFPYKWQICRKRRGEKNETTRLLRNGPIHTQRTWTQPPLARTSVTHTHAPFEAKVNLSTSLSLPGAGQAQGTLGQAAAASEKCIHVFGWPRGKHRDFSWGAKPVSVFPFKGRKEKIKRHLTGSAFTTYADWNKIGAKLIQGNPNHLAYR